MYALCSVPSRTNIAGAAYAVSEYAVVKRIADDPGDPTRVLVRVIEGKGDLEADREFLVDASRLMTLQEAQAQLEVLK